MFQKVAIFALATLLLAACAQESAPKSENAPATASAPAAPSAPVVDIEALVASADPDTGKRYFIMCQACHSVNEGGINKVGPNLYGLYGAPAAKAEGFIYSDALTSAGIVWDTATLDAWLKNPAGLAPGTTMVFPGIQDAEQRAGLIAYLRVATASK